jgi:hypothetical protein
MPLEYAMFYQLKWQKRLAVSPKTYRLRIAIESIFQKGKDRFR